MHAVSSNPIPNILHFNDKDTNNYLPALLNPSFPFPLPATPLQHRNRRSETLH